MIIIIDLQIRRLKFALSLKYWFCCSMSLCTIILNMQLSMLLLTILFFCVCLWLCCKLSSCNLFLAFAGVESGLCRDNYEFYQVKNFLCFGWSLSLDKCHVNCNTTKFVAAQQLQRKNVYKSQNQPFTFNEERKRKTTTTIVLPQEMTQGQNPTLSDLVTSAQERVSALEARQRKQQIVFLLLFIIGVVVKLLCLSWSNTQSQEDVVDLITFTLRAISHWEWFM